MFRSNVHPSKFGKGQEKLVDWTCICDTFNKSWWAVCQGCGIPRKLALQAQEERNG